LVDADQLLVELKNGLSQQELNFTEFVEQQHEVCKLHYANFLPIDYSHVDYNIFVKKITHTGTI
jgi:hypothetical protein